MNDRLGQLLLRFDQFGVVDASGDKPSGVVTIVDASSSPLQDISITGLILQSRAV